MKKLYYDNRGYVGTLCQNNCLPSFDNVNFVEDRVSKSKYGVIRGLHGDVSTYKLLTCIYGKILFVQYDFVNNILQEQILSEDDDITVTIKPYTLNGHQCLSEECIIYYKWSEYYSLGSQWTVKYNDPDININWFDIDPILSERDKNGINLKDLKYE